MSGLGKSSLHVEQPEIAGEAATKFKDNIERAAFRVELVTDDGGDESLRWHGVHDGEPVTFDTEPKVGAGTKLAVSLLRLLPIDWLL